MKRHKDAADVVLFASPGELAEMNPPRRRHKTLEHSVLDSSEYDSFLVKTALIRAEDWDPSRQVIVSDSHSAYRAVKHIAHYDQEHLLVLALSVAGHLVAIHEAAIGGVTSVTQTTKILVKVAFLTNAASVIVVHNHPSGISTPSEADRKFTHGLLFDLDCYGVNLVDHIIVAHDGYFSFADANQLVQKMGFDE